MNRQQTEYTRQQQDTYEQGRIDADNSTAVGILLEHIERAQSFRLYRGQQLRPGTLVSMELSDLISVN